MKKLETVKLNTVSSTSTYARENISSLSLPSLITADCQTNGRGRQGKSFYSPADSGLYMTLAFEVQKPLPLITPAAAVAVCETIEEISAIRPSIKWVNDIFLNGKKVCGILSEALISNGKTVYLIGIGINLTTSEFPKELDIAGSLNLETDKQLLAESISNRILDFAQNGDGELTVNEYRKRLFILGRDITFTENNKEYRATVKDINEFCNLIVELPDGNKKILSSGEISIKI